MTFTVKVVEMDGTVLETLDNATDVSVTKTLRSEESFSFGSPKFDPATSAVGLLDTEVQVFVDGHLAPKAWGPVLSDDASSGDGKVTFQGRGAYWYFRRRYFGTADRVSSIVNGDFETGGATGVLDPTIDGWEQHGGAIWHYTTATKPDPVYPDPLTGTKAVATFASAGEDAYLVSRWDYTTSFPPGQRVTVAGWINTAEWVAPAAFSLGIWIRYLVDDVQVREGIVLLEEDTNDIAGNEDGWVRLSTSMIVPPNLDGEIEARFYMPGGAAAWDTTQSVLMESTGSGTGNDQAFIAENVIIYAQEGRGKSDLLIGTDCPETGVIRKRSWQHVDHEWIDAAIDAVSDFPDGFDYRVDYDDASTRTFRTFFPYCGNDRRGELTLMFKPGDEAQNVASYQRPRDASGVSTSVIASAPGISGPTREEGIAQDLVALGGLVLEERFDAPDDVGIGELDDCAATQLEDVIDVTRSITVVITDPELIDMLEEPGDIVDLVIDDGYVQEDGEFRIVQTTMTQTSLSVVLNPWRD